MRGFRSRQLAPGIGARRGPGELRRALTGEDIGTGERRRAGVAPREVPYRRRREEGDRRGRRRQRRQRRRFNKFKFNGDACVQAVSTQDQGPHRVTVNGCRRDDRPVRRVRVAVRRTVPARAAVQSRGALRGLPRRGGRETRADEKL